MTEVLTFSKYATASEIAELFNVSKSTIHKMADKGEIPKPIKIGRNKRWDMKLIKAWLEANN